MKLESQKKRRAKREDDRRRTSARAVLGKRSRALACLLGERELQYAGELSDVANQEKKSATLEWSSMAQ